MSKANWGGVAAVGAIAVVVVVVLLMRGVFNGGAPSAPSVDADESSAQDARSQVAGAGVDEDMQRETTDSGDTEDAVTVAAPDDEPDDRVADREGGAADTASTGSGATVDALESVAVEESGQAPDETLQAEAETFVRELAESSGDPVPADGVEGFMGPDRTLSSILPGSDALDSTRRDTGTADVPATEPDTAPAQGAPDAQGDSIQSTAADGTSPDDADAAGADTVQPQSITTEADDSSVSDAREAGAGDALETRVDLPLSEETPVTIAELLGAEDAVASDAVFYVHTVRPDDDLGIWGIVHDGITENFAEGVAVHRGESVETYRVDIPSDADQLDADRSSSFLGKIIYEKSLMTYVYNYRTDRLGRNPDLIMPGQEIVIVSFTPEELIEIYKYFAGDR